jgi:hypothetical protein
MEVLHNLDLAIDLLEVTALFFCFFLRSKTGVQRKIYWLQITEVPKFQANVCISMVLREVFKSSAVIDLDSGIILLIDDVFRDVH